MRPSTSSPSRGVDSLAALEGEDCRTPPDLITGAQAPVEFRSAKLPRNLFHTDAGSAGRVQPGEGGKAQGPPPEGISRSLFDAGSAGGAVAVAQNPAPSASPAPANDLPPLSEFALPANVQLSSERPLMIRGASDPTEYDYSAMPLFRGLVKRSTRFTTSVPAVQVLRLIHQIIEDGQAEEAHAAATGGGSTTTTTGGGGGGGGSSSGGGGTQPQQRQTVTVDFETYQLEVKSADGVRMCRVHIFLMKAGLYMVEFIRDETGIFQFKRFYEDIRAKLSAIVKKDHTLQLLAARPQTSAHSLGRVRMRRSHTC